jgi:hypothetical protein
VLNCTRGANPTCAPNFEQPTTLTLEDIHSPGSKDAAGSFGLINLNQADDGNIGAGTLADWLLNGYPDLLSPGNYNSAPSANFNNSQFTSALDQQIGRELMFPVYRILRGPGANAVYQIIGPGHRQVRGVAARTIWPLTCFTTDGVPAENGGGGPAWSPRSSRPTNQQRRKRPSHDHRLRTSGSDHPAVVAALLTTFYVTNYKRSTRRNVPVYAAT